MEKLELKHLAPYLPYALKVLSKRHFCKYGEQTILEINGFAFQGVANIPHWQYEFVYDNDLKFSDINEKGFKPILRPLSDLPKVFEEMTEQEKEIIIHCERLISSKSLWQEPYFIIEILLKYHFDVFGLIEKGLAVDINTL